MKSWGILYLHGVGHGVHTDAWYGALADTLQSHGIELPPMRSRRIMVPTYVDLLNVPLAEAVKPPPSTPKDKRSAADQLRARAEYRRRQAAAVRDLPQTTSSMGFGGALQGVDPARMPAPSHLANAKKYLRSERIRAAVMHRVIASLGAQRDLIVIGHSLGSLVGIDFLDHLPERVRVHRFITIGSPAGLSGMWKSRPDALQNGFPYHRVDGWVNVLGVADPVTRGLGVAHRFPQAIDVRISTGTGHAAHLYLRHPAVGQLLAETIQPSPPASTGKEIELSPSPQENEAIDAVAFGYLVARVTKDQSRAQRLTLAMDAVRDHTVHELIRQRRENHQPVPGAIEDLRRQAPSVDLFSFRGPEEELFFAVLAGTNNPVAPYEIDAPEQMRAVNRLWQAYGYSREDADTVCQAIRDAIGAYGKSQWPKVVVGAVGVALLAAGPVGLMVMAPAGLAGAAAITSALAAFGPGGMVGGMALAGSLIGAGGALSAGAAMSSTAMSSDVLQTQCIRIMAYSYAHRKLDRPGSLSAGWQTLSTWRSELANEHTTLAELSDKDASTVKVLATKRKIVDKAIEWLVERGIGDGSGHPPDGVVTGEVVEEAPHTVG